MQDIRQDQEYTEDIRYRAHQKKKRLTRQNKNERVPYCTENYNQGDLLMGKKRVKITNSGIIVG